MRFSGEQNTCIANCKKKSRSLVPFDLCDKLRRPPVDVHENGLLGQRRPEILRPAEAIDAPRLFGAHRSPAAASGDGDFLPHNRPGSLRIAKSTSHTLRIDVNQFRLPDPWPTRTVSQGLWALHSNSSKSSIALSRTAPTRDARSCCGISPTCSLVGSDQYSEEEIDLIDDVFVRLVATIEQSSRALLSLRLAPVPVAPPKILRFSPAMTPSRSLHLCLLRPKHSTSER